MDTNALIDKFLQERPTASAAPPPAVVSVKELSPYLHDVSKLTTRLSAFTLKQMAREQKVREGHKRKPRGAKHYRYKRRKNTEYVRAHAYQKYLSNKKHNQTLPRKYKRMLRTARDEGVEGPHMTFDEYMLMWLTKVPKQIVNGELVSAHLAMGDVMKIGGLRCQRLDRKRGFTLDNVHVVRNLGQCEYEEIWRQGTNDESPCLTDAAKDATQHNVIHS